MNKEREILKALINAANSPRNKDGQVILEYDFDDNTITVIIGGGHVHCGVPDGSYEQMVSDLYGCLVKDDPLTWDRYFTDPGFKKTEGAPARLTDAKYDADNPHCRECDCAACHYFAKVEKALDRAAKYVSEVVEGCPIALELGYEICKEDGCDNDAAVCWMKYFLSEEARRGGEGV